MISLKSDVVKPGFGTSAAEPELAKVATVFAGGDEAAVAHLRSLLSIYPPSSPSMALFRDGKPLYMLHRSDIERRDPAEIAELLKDVFDRFCAPSLSAK